MNKNIKFALIASLGILLLFISVDGFIIVSWSAFGHAGPAFSEFCKALGISFLTAAIVWLFVEKKSSDEMSTRFDKITTLVSSPELVLSKIEDNKFISLLGKHAANKYQINKDVCSSIFFIISRILFKPREYREIEDTQIYISPESCHNRYIKLVITKEYTLRSTANLDLKFCCVFSEERDKVIHKEGYQISWTFLSSPTDVKMPDNAFVIKEVCINGDPVNFDLVHHNSGDSIIEYIVHSGNTRLDGAKIWYKFEVLQFSGYGFVSSHTKRITRDMTVTFDYSSCEEIRNVWVSSALLAEGGVREFIKSNSKKAITVKADGWIFPKGSVLFSWNQMIDK